MIKHHNFFKVHLPKKDYKGENEDELAEIIMEEFHLFSNGEMTKDYNSINPKEDKFEISLYPSILYATNKLNYTQQEKFQTINNFIDNAFVDFLERFDPLYKCTSFIEYHLYFYKGNKNDFYKHIKYQIIPLIKKRKEKNKKRFDYENLVRILNDWIESKIKKQDNFKTQIKTAKNVIVNNKSDAKTQLINHKTIKKNRIEFYSILIAIIGIVISIIIGWDKLIIFFKK